MTLYARFGWIEIPASDIERAANFYGLLFETRLEIGEMISGIRSAFLPVPDKRHLGPVVVIMEGKGYMPAGFQGCHLFFEGEPNMEAFLARVEEAGGSIELSPHQIGTDSKRALLAMFFDTEGNLMGVHSTG